MGDQSSYEENAVVTRIVKNPMCIKNVENNVYVVNLNCHMPGVELVRMYSISYKKSPYMFNNCC